MRGAVTFIYLLFFTGTFILRAAIRRKTLAAERVQGTIIALWTTKYIFYAYLAILFGSLVEYFLVPREVNVFVSSCGLLLYIAGIAGRQWAHASLGRYWSVNIEIRENHELIRKGPYRYMRHPNNVFHSLEVIGLTLVPNAYFALSLFVAAYLPVLIYRSVVEEKAMGEALKEAYTQYKAEVPAFL